MRQVEEVFGRERFDTFLKAYFDHFAFQSITTADFVAYLKQNLLDANPQLVRDPMLLFDRGSALDCRNARDRDVVSHGDTSRGSCKQANDNRPSVDRLLY